MTLTQFYLSIIKKHLKYIYGLFFVAVYWAISNAVTPYVLKLIIDTVVSLKDEKSLLFHAIQPLVILYITLWALLATDMRLLDWLRLRLYPSIRYDIMENMYTYLTRHSHQYFQNNFAGSLSNKIFDMQSGFVTIFTTLDEAFAQCVGLFIAMIAMFIVHPVFACIFALWAIFFISVTLYYSKPIQEYSNIFSTSKTMVVGKMVDSISNISNMRLFSRHRYENQLMRAAMIETVNRDREMQWYILKMHIFWDLSIVFLIGLNLYTLVYMYGKGLVTIGDFSFIISLSMSMFFNLWFMASQFVTFSEELGKCRQALTIITPPHDVVDKANAAPLHVSHGKIEFHNVTFHYDENRRLFNNKNVVVEAGQKVGLVGYSGGGKSSFVNLILRLYDVESGDILIDHQNIADVTQDSLRESIALIPQDVSLFHRSLMDNIRYGRIDASDEAVFTASKKAHCHEFIMNLPEGYESLVGERGIKLSGGQRQRIAIARAILKNAPILILDEATSQLDSVTEIDIQESLWDLMQGKTTLVIAHRLSTLLHMDRILVFDQGKIVEDGSHQELLTKNGLYKTLWDAQVGGFLPDNKINTHLD